VQSRPKGHLQGSTGTRQKAPTHPKVRTVCNIFEGATLREGLRPSDAPNLAKCAIPGSFQCRQFKVADAPSTGKPGKPDNTGEGTIFSDNPHPEPSEHF
jgi:hypothetical protein